jgi:hypothetical protein
LRKPSACSAPCGINTAYYSDRVGGIEIREGYSTGGPTPDYTKAYIKA